MRLGPFGTALLLSGLLSATACSHAESPRYTPEDGAGADALPQTVLDGLAVDERVLACAKSEASGVIEPLKLEWTVHRPDFNDDGLADWLVAGRDPCLRRGAATPWWVFVADTGKNANVGRDGPARVLRAGAEAVALLDTRTLGYRDLALSQAGASRIFRFTQDRYEANPAPAAAQADRLIADFRQPNADFSPELSDAEQRQIIESVFGHGAEATINSVAEGRFTSTKQPERLLLAQRGGPRAAHSGQGEQAAEILRYAENMLQARYALGAADGHFIAATPDVDGDGRQEVLLRDDSYQMGVHISHAVLVRLHENRVEILQRFPNVRVDGCDGPPLTQHRRAVRIRTVADTAPAQFAIDAFEAACDANAAFKPAKASSS